VPETGVHNGCFGADEIRLKKLKGSELEFGAPHARGVFMGAAKQCFPPMRAIADYRRIPRRPQGQGHGRSLNRQEQCGGRHQSITAETIRSALRRFLKHAEGRSCSRQDLYGAPIRVPDQDPSHNELPASLFSATLLNPKRDIGACEKSSCQN